MKTLYLPSDEDTTIELVCGGKRKTADVFDIDQLMTDASEARKESGKPVWYEFAALLAKKYKLPIKPGPAYLLWEAVSTRIEELKKSLFLGSDSPTKPDASE